MFNFEYILTYRIPNLLIALTIHEFCHGFVAYLCGDPTAKQAGRLTLNPIVHLDPIGTLCLLFAPIGWAKPVPVNPYNFKNPGRDNILVSLAGPLSNLIIALIMGTILRLTDGMVLPIMIKNFLLIGVLMNIGIALFNLLPISPLDGSHILREFLSYHARESYDSFNRIAPFIFLGIILFVPELLWMVLKPPFAILMWLFTGSNILAW